jgi:hypothetical protein
MQAGTVSAWSFDFIHLTVVAENSAAIVRNPNNLPAVSYAKMAAILLPAHGGCSLVRNEIFASTLTANF